ncbi:FAD-dependent oxidoreductase [Marinobacter pelagius]|uniref:NAD(P)/FAD-dependent oxidoreductase n=1 Tax=Marinobacter sp. C7 TaxID=2951363 RepID=UPI001EF104C4|nr:FAD-dependent oxidoreductase [Marinobacter sp. C7]MCG7198777.1 FAD-dependent oxidoreductase [Marinobacter sp. C7]
MKPLPHVLILGAGYAGLMAASRILRSREANVTVITTRSRFEQRIRLHEVLTGRPVQSPSIRDWLGHRHARLVTDRVLDIDVVGKSVTTRTARYAYDYLLFALGSEVDRSAVPGAAQHAVFIDGQADTSALSRRFRSLQDTGGNVVFVGAGLTNLESASELAERFPALRITLVSRGRLFDDFSDQGQRYLRFACRRLNIRLLEGREVQRVTETAVMLTDGSRLEADLTVVAAGFRASGLGRQLTRSAPDITLDPRGRIPCQPDLSVGPDKTVWIAGDACHLAADNQRPYRMGCVLALPMGAHAGENIVRTIRGRETRDFRFGFMFRCISLGRRDALIQWTGRDDTPLAKVTTGHRAVRIKEWVCRLTCLAPKWELKTGLRLYRWPQPRNADVHAEGGQYDAG